MSHFETPRHDTGDESFRLVTPDYVARWLFDEITSRGGFFAEQTAALEIARLFDGPFVHSRMNGELAVRSSVLHALRQLAGDRVKWDGVRRGWRLVSPRKTRAT